jgi:hypothetical protein
VIGRLGFPERNHSPAENPSGRLLIPVSVTPAPHRPCSRSSPQADIDTLWNRLTADGGAEVACGWLKDKFRMSWQIVPSELNAWLDSGTPEQIERMFGALFRMTKVDTAALQQAFDGD